MTKSGLGALSGVAAAMVLGAAVAGAQACTTPSSNSTTTRKCTVAVTAGTYVVNKLGVLTLSSNANISLATPDGPTYDAGYRIELAALARTAIIKANAPWNLTVAPSSATACTAGVCWSATDLAPPSPTVAANKQKPASDFLVATTYDPTGAAYVPLPNSNTPAGSSVLLSSQPATAGQTATLYWAEVWNYFSDTPGSYSLPFVVTLTIP